MLTGSHHHDNTRTIFRIYKISVPELPSGISSPEDMFQDSLKRVYVLIGETWSELTKSQERIQTLFNSMISKYQHFKLQMQPHSVSGFDISLYKANSWGIFVSTDMAPDISAGLNPCQGISRVFREPSNIDPHTSRLRSQTRFVTSLSCDIKPNITNYTSRNIFVSADLDPDMTTVIDYGRVISWVFRKLFLLNSSCHGFEKFN